MLLVLEVLAIARRGDWILALLSSTRGEEFRTRVLNAMAHNLKTPLTSVTAAASLLRASGVSLSVHDRELVAVIDEEADRLNRVIRESLDLAKLEARRTDRPCRFKNVALCRAVRAYDRYTGGSSFDNRGHLSCGTDAGSGSR